MRLALAPLLAALAVPIGVATAPSASALSCVGPETVLEDAASIYTGRIVDGGDHRIEVEVEEIWRGEPVASRLSLRAGLEGWWQGVDMAGGIPDGYSPPGTWLFAPQDGSVSPCSAWRLGEEYVDEDVASYRPAEPRQPVTPVESPAKDRKIDGGAGEHVATGKQGTSDAEQWLFVGGVGGGLAALAGGLSWWGLRRSRG